MRTETCHEWLTVGGYLKLSNEIIQLFAPKCTAEQNVYRFDSLLAFFTWCRTQTLAHVAPACEPLSWIFKYEEPFAVDDDDGDDEDEDSICGSDIFGGDIFLIDRFHLKWSTSYKHQTHEPNTILWFSSKFFKRDESRLVATYACTHTAQLSSAHTKWTTKLLLKYLVFYGFRWMCEKIVGHSSVRMANDGGDAAIYSPKPKIVYNIHMI